MWPVGLINLALPVRCVACGELCDADLCAACADAIGVVHAACSRCGASACDGCDGYAGVGAARSLLVYGGPAARLVVAIKRRGRSGLAAECGRLLAGLAAREGIDPHVVTWVPAGRRADQKGFDHAQLLARATARTLGVPCRALLRRARLGTRQSKAALGDRRANVEGAFERRRAVRGNVLIVDDVLTTGATVEACAAELADAGAGWVDVVTLARSVLRRSRA